MKPSDKIVRSNFIGRLLREKQIEIGISETQIAINMGLKESGQGNINRYLNGKLVTTDDTFYKIGKAIGLTDKEINKIFKEADIEEFMYKYGEEIGNIDKELTILEALEFIESKAELSTAEKIVLDEIKNKNK